MAAVNDTAPSELVIERVVDAPRERVFDAFTQAEHLRRWWGPKMNSVLLMEFEARPGGKIFLAERGSDGTVHHIAGAVREIVRPSRLVYGIHFADADGRRVAPPAMTGLPATWADDIVTLIEFHAEGAHTRLTIRTLSGFTAEWAAKARFGWAESLDKLDQVVASAVRQT